MKGTIMKFSHYLMLTIVIASCGVAECRETSEKDHEHIQKDEKVESSLIRDFEIEVATLDANKDGKVF
jgi:hypothetical protein